MRDHSRSLRPSPGHSPAADQSCWLHLRTYWRCPPPPVRSAPVPFGHRLPAKTGQTQWLLPFPRPAGARKFRRFLPLQQWMPHRCPQPQKQPWAQCSAPLPVSETPQGFVSLFIIPFYFICTGSTPLYFRFLLYRFLQHFQPLFPLPFIFWIVAQSSPRIYWATCQRQLPRTAKFLLFRHKRGVNAFFVHNFVIPYLYKHITQTEILLWNTTIGTRAGCLPPPLTRR